MLPLRRALLLAALLGSTVTVGPLRAQVRPTSQVELKTGTLIFSTESNQEFLSARTRAREPVVHGLARFDRHPTQPEQEQLARRGIRILSHFVGTVYRVSVARDFSPRALDIRQLTLSFVLPQHKTAPPLLAGDFEKYRVMPPDSQPVNYVLNADGTINVSVTFYEDVDEDQIRGALGRHALRPEKLSDQQWLATLSRTQLAALAAEDPVQWIDAPPPPFLPDNDRTRIALNVNAVQNFNLATSSVQGLGGSGVLIGIFDFGIDETHVDFGTTRVVRTHPGRSAHGTHVAGTAAGNGHQSHGTDNQGKANGGAPVQWRGMAPEAHLIDAAGGPTKSVNTATWADYIKSPPFGPGLDISNHSYSVSFDGSYDATNRLLDQIIRGAATSAGSPIPARLHVYSAGNHGVDNLNGGQQVGYFSLTKQVKNGIMVGNLDLASNTIAQSSGLGPTHDGRIKPDVVAPGDSVMSTGYCDGVVSSNGVAINEPATFCTNPATGAAFQRQNFYRPMSGTSMAAPAVTGVLALVLQQWSANVSLDNAAPWPSTLRAALIHAATDIAAQNPWFTNRDGAVQAFLGPDFVTGYGMVNAQEAVDLVRNRYLRQDSLLATCDTTAYEMVVPPNQLELKITLAWDDVEGNPSLQDAAPKLVNDLDLILIAPDGREHYSWLLDQEALDAAGNPVADADQVCGTQLRIQRRFMPAVNPIFKSDINDVNNINDVMSAGGPPRAGTGRDHLNNLEQVVVMGPAAGAWQIRVVGFNVPSGPQRFSVAGLPPVVFDARRLCERHGELCRRVFTRNICQLSPRLCQPVVVFPTRDELIVQFTDLNQRVIVPLEGMCGHVRDCRGCEANGLCPGSVLVFENMPDALRLDLYDGRGRRIRSDATDRTTKTLQLPDDVSEPLFLIISPGRDTEAMREYRLRLGVR